MTAEKDWTGNSNSIFKTLGASNHTDKERQEDDYYATSPEAIDKLLTVETPNHRIWECACVDGETEYFDGSRWKKISEYSDNDRVLCYDNGKAVLEFPIKYHKIYSDDLMYHYTSKNLDMKLSKEHRVVFHHRRNDKIQILLAEEVFEKYKNDRNGFRGKIPTSFHYKGELVLDEYLLRLAVACNADGRTRTKKKTYEIRVKKEHKKIRMRYLLEKAKIPYKIKQYNGYDDFSFISPYGCKHFPWEWINLTNELKEVILEEIQYWDGRVTDGCIQFFTSKKEDADFIQFLAHSIGRAAYIGVDERERKNYKTAYRVGLKNVTKFSVTKCKSNGNGGRLTLEKSADNFHYCFTVRTGILILRRNNKIFVTGNCGGGHLSERLKGHGFEVYSTDIKERGYPLDGLQDFLTATESPFEGGQYDILTNPPYKYAKEFVLKSLELLQPGQKCYMFLKLQFLEGAGRYEEIFSVSPPRSVYVFSKRILCAKNAEFERMKEGGGSAVAYAWFVWEKGFTGKTEISWI